MKKLSLYVFLILMICNVGFAECIEGDCSNGYGTYTTNNGDKHVGEWKDGIPHGQGTFISANGNKYVGEFKKGEYHGQGTYTWADGSKYVGEFKGGSQDGQGTFTWANGDKYVGEFIGGERYGQGTATFVDGTVINGIWNKGELVERNKIQTQIAKKEPEKKEIKKEKKIESVGYNCKVGSKGDEIAFANLKFGENIFETFCRLKQNLKSENYYVMLSTGENLYTGFDGKERHRQLSNYVKNIDITKLSNANLIANSINEHFCQKDKLLNSYYQRFVTNFENIDTVKFKNYRFEIYPIYLGGASFNLELNFSNSKGHLLNDDFTLNENVPIVEVCVDRSNSTKKIHLPFRLTSIVLYAYTYPELLSQGLHDDLRYYIESEDNIKKFTKEASDKVFENLTNLIKDKYKIKYLENAEKSTAADNFRKEFRGFHFTEVYQCASMGQIFADKLFYTSDKISSLIGSQCGRITLFYFSNLVQKEVHLDSAQFLNDISRIKRLEDAKLNKELNKNKEKGSSGQL
ncbi:MAG: hypothetical protein QF864_01225 [SAR202 cluster bacterium]|nr:hypothetical protein [SAR202 cluster bacterium]